MKLVSTLIFAFPNTLQRDQASGTLEAILATPRAPALLILSSCIMDFIEVTVMQCLFIGMGVAFFGVRLQINVSILLVIACTLLACILLFASIGLCIAGLTLVIKRGAIQIAGYIMSGFALLGAVYYPVDVLPKPLRIIGQLLPFTWAVQILRSSLLGGELLLGRLLLLVIFALFAVPIGIYILQRSLDQSRRQGTLGHY